MNFRVGGSGRKLFKIDPHGKSIYFDDAVRSQYLRKLVLIPQNSKDTLQEMVGVVIVMKSDQVGSQQSFQNLSAPFIRKEPENFKRRERNVQKEPDR